MIRSLPRPRRNGFLRPASGIRILQADGALDTSERVRTGLGLAEETRTTGRLRLRTHLGLVARRDEDDRVAILDSGESLSQVQPGHPPKSISGGEPADLLTGF